MPELEIELLDAQRGKSCPCCLDEDRHSQGSLHFRKKVGLLSRLLSNFWEMLYMLGTI